ncbi:MAG: hypothetical protein WAK95_20615 [Desulfobacterales bacterium]
MSADHHRPLYLPWYGGFYIGQPVPYKTAASIPDAKTFIFRDEQQSLLEPGKIKPAMEPAVDVSAIRTPVGKLHGRLKNIATRDLIAAGQPGKGAA